MFSYRLRGRFIFLFPICCCCAADIEDVHQSEHLKTKIRKRKKQQQQPANEHGSCVCVRSTTSFMQFISSFIRFVPMYFTSFLFSAGFIAQQQALHVQSESKHLLRFSISFSLYFHLFLRVFFGAITKRYLITFIFLSCLVDAFFHFGLFSMHDALLFFSVFFSFLTLRHTNAHRP